MPKAQRPRPTVVGGPFDHPLNTRVSERAWKALYFGRLVYQMDTTQLVSNAILEYAAKHEIFELAKRQAEEAT